MLIQQQLLGEGSFKAVFKAVKFALSQRVFDDSIEQIRYNNSILRTLTSQNIELEPLRLHQYRSVSNRFKAAQKHARSLYRVIENSWQCQCSISHSANVCLDARLVNGISSKTQEQLTTSDENVQFDVIFSSDSTGIEPLPWSWRETNIRLLSIRDDVEPQHPSVTLNIPAPPAKSYAKPSILRAHRSLRNSIFRSNSSGRKSVTFMSEPTWLSESSTVCHPATVPSTPITSISTKSGFLLSPNDLLKLNKISNLCQAIQNPQDEHCLGYLSPDSRHALAIYYTNPGEPRLDHSAVTSFKELMGPRPTSDRLPLARGNLPLSWGERLEIALIVASSILQLQQTPWLRDDWTKEDFSLCKDYTDKKKQHVLVSKRFPANKYNDSTRAAQLFLGLPRNKTLFALGIFLIELCLGEAFESLRSLEDPLDTNGHANILTDLSAADRLTKNIYEEVGDRYGDVVRRCIHCDFNQRSVNLEDDDFRQAVCEGVIMPLQANTQELRNEFTLRGTGYEH